MTHLNYLLNGEELNSRLKIYNLVDTCLIEESQVLSQFPQGNITLYLLGLKFGEFITIDKSIWFRVIKGSVFINGHVYNDFMPDYRKFIVPPWMPTERLISLCSDEDVKNDCNFNGCSTCNDLIFQNFHGGTCCSIRKDYRYTREYIRNLLGIEQNESINYNGKFKSHLADVLIAFYSEEYDTLLCFIDYHSAFGTIKVPSALKLRYPLKIIQKDLNDVAKILLQVKGTRLPILMLHGDIGMGKTSTIIYLINYLLNFVSTVALLDVDIGQPIATPPGLISLSFFDKSITVPQHSLINEIKPEAKYLLGDVRYDNPNLFLNHVRRCVKIYEQSTGGDFNVPMLINTFGWITQFGAKLLDLLLSIANVAILLKLTNNVKNQKSIVIKDHEDLKGIIESNLYMQQKDIKRGEIQQDDISINISTIDYDNIEQVQEYKEIILPSFNDYINLSKDLINSVINHGFNSCKFNSWNNISVKLLCSPYRPNLRWLRLCSYLNSAFGDAMHFPQLEYEEFFDGLDTPNFKLNIKDRSKFILMKQLLLITDKFSFVVLNDTPISDLSQLSPLVNGSLIAICSGYVKDRIQQKISDKWKFITYAYVHFFDLNNYNIMISYPQNVKRTNIINANIIVFCLSLRFHLSPPHMLRIGYLSDEYEGLSESSSTTQCLPYRRNSLLHLMGTFGAGLSAPSTRTNIKRFKND